MEPFRKVSLILLGSITEGYRFTFQMDEGAYIFRRIGLHNIEKSHNRGTSARVPWVFLSKLES